MRGLASMRTRENLAQGCSPSGSIAYCSEEYPTMYHTHCSIVSYKGVDWWIVGDDANIDILRVMDVGIEPSKLVISCVSIVPLSTYFHCIVYYFDITCKFCLALNWIVLFAATTHTHTTTTITPSLILIGWTKVDEGQAKKMLKRSTEWGGEEEGGVLHQNTKSFYPSIPNSMLNPLMACKNALIYSTRSISSTLATPLVLAYPHLNKLTS